MPVKIKSPVPSDIEIAQEAELLPITEVAKDAGVLDEELELHGKYMAKVDYNKVLERLKDKPYGKIITVTAMTPTPLGEGKTVCAFGLGQALAKKKLKAVNTFREPSKGPTFGIKGGAAGGGYSQGLPMENINLMFTGDIPAVETAQNLCAAAIDASILHGKEVGDPHRNPLNIDPLNISWTYCVDANARALRDVMVGLGGVANGYPRLAHYDITVATETAAILALTTGLKDLRERLRRIVVAYTYDGKPVTAGDLGVDGAMTALLVDAIKPNLVQSTEGHPMFCHGFPFANVAHGNNSTMADLVAMKLADYMVTENGFGVECGYIKFCEVVCREARWAGYDIWPDCCVIVASIRALKQHGGAFHLRPGMAYSKVKEAAETENLPAVEKGCENLARNIEIARMTGVPVVVAINRFTSDTDKEVELVRRKALEAGAVGAAPTECWAKGGEGSMELADEALKALKTPKKPQPLYEDETPTREKIELFATKIFGADGTEYTPEAESRLKLFEKLDFRANGHRLTVNMAKTHLSLAHDLNMLGVPRNYKLPIRDIRASVGAGFYYPLCGVFPTMPGLPTKPAFLTVDVDTEMGKIKGLF
jgi:formate--tetrahydrofolate ligase